MFVTIVYTDQPHTLSDCAIVRTHGVECTDILHYFDIIAYIVHILHYFDIIAYVVQRTFITRQNILI